MKMVINIMKPRWIDLIHLHFHDLLILAQGVQIVS